MTNTDYALDLEAAAHLSDSQMNQVLLDACTALGQQRAPTLRYRGFTLLDVLRIARGDRRESVELSTALGLGHTAMISELAVMIAYRAHPHMSAAEINRALNIPTAADHEGL